MDLGCEDNSSGHRLAPAQPEEKWASHKCFQFNYSIPYHRTIFKSQPMSGWDKRSLGWCSCKAAKIWAGEQVVLLFVHLPLVPFPLADSLREWRVHHPPRGSRGHLLYNQQRKGEFTPSRGKGLPKSHSSVSLSPLPRHKCVSSWHFMELLGWVREEEWPEELERESPAGLQSLPGNTLGWTLLWNLCVNDHKTQFLWKKSYNSPWFLC